jgi:hypothetical protein
MVTLIINILLIAILVGVGVYFMFFTPKYTRPTESTEGFFGGVARGSGHPDCLRTLPEGSEILDMILKRVNVNGGDPDDAPTTKGADYREFQLILSKLGCLKKDLMSPSGIVEATRYQAFETAHDRINVAEVCAMCISKNIPSRDLDIIFATWRDRGKVLLRRLCTEANLNKGELSKAEALFNKSWSDVYDIAKSKCLKTDFSKQNGGSTAGGDVGGYEPENLKDLREYTNKYGGMSASGWNSNV